MDYLSLLLGLLLSISEILPYIKKIQGNGIINILQSFITKQSEIGNNLLAHMESSEPLIQSPSQESQPNQASQESPQSELLSEISKINSILNEYILAVNQQNNFSLKTPDQYQLIYIENSLKNNFTKKLEFKYISDENTDILKSLGYKIEYMHNEDKYFIHW